MAYGKGSCPPTISDIEGNAIYATILIMEYNNSHLRFDEYNKKYGFSVRCIKD